MNMSYKKILFVVSLCSMLFTMNGYAQQQIQQQINSARQSRGSAMVDKSNDKELQALIAETVDKFKVMTYVDELTNDTMIYNLFIPDNYDSTKEYPLVMFIGDASTSQKESSVPLTQGYGGIIWASAQEQAKNPCFVLVPQYKTKTVQDDYSTTYEVDETIRLLKSVINDYSVDEDRIYKTGQSMGGMMSLYYGINNPELFAASIYVGCQWDASKMADFVNQPFFYSVAEGDMKAPKGRNELTVVLMNNGAKISEANWSAKAPQAEQELNVQKLLAEGNSINYITFDRNTVLPENGGGNEHMCSFDYAYKLSGVRDWLFKQNRKNK